MKDVNLCELSLAELAIGHIASMELAAAIALGRELEQIKNACRASVYWPDFRAQVQAGTVHEDFAGPGIISRCVIGWAKEAA